MTEEIEQEQAEDDGAESDEDTSCTRCDGRLLFAGIKDCGYVEFFVRVKK